MFETTSTSIALQNALKSNGIKGTSHFLMYQNWSLAKKLFEIIPTS